jgi:hypothetical protein
VAEQSGLAVRKRAAHWYRQYVGECPVCGKDKSYRQRVDGPKPTDKRSRYVQLSQQECYDGCLDRGC